MNHMVTGERREKISCMKKHGSATNTKAISNRIK